MTHRQYDSTQIASIYIEVRPSPTKELIKSIIDQLAKSCPSNSNGRWPLAVDVGCGSGQATFLLADYFDQVIGFDISEPQIKEANQRNKFKNVSFRISQGEDIPLENNSAQLITVCEALHFFDIDKFNRKVDSLLVPGGLFVAISYYPTPKCTMTNGLDCESFNNLVNDQIERTLQLWHDHGFPVKIFVDQIKSKYRCINLPFEKVCHEDTFQVTMKRSARYVIDLINSLGTSENFRLKHPEKDTLLMNGIHNELYQFFSTRDLDSIQVDYTFEYFLICFKK